MAQVGTITNFYENGSELISYSKDEMFDKILIRITEIHQKDKTQYNFDDIKKKVTSLTCPSLYYDLSLNLSNQ